MADKSTRTDDALLLNGEVDSGNICPPTTTNAATMTTVAAVQTEPVSPRPIVQVVAGGGPRNHMHRQESRTDYSKQPPTPPPTVRKFAFDKKNYMHNLELLLSLLFIYFVELYQSSPNELCTGCTASQRQCSKRKTKKRETN